jgi:hypothetical protein
MPHGCVCFVPEPGQNIHLPLPKKKQAAREMLGFLVNVSVLVGSGLDAYSAGRSSSLGGSPKLI